MRPGLHLFYTNAEIIRVHCSAMRVLRSDDIKFLPIRLCEDFWVVAVQYELNTAWMKTNPTLDAIISKRAFDERML